MPLEVVNTMPLLAPPISAGNYVSGSLYWGLLVGRGDIYFQLYPGGVTTLATCECECRGKQPSSSSEKYSEGVLNATLRCRGGRIDARTVAGIVLHHVPCFREGCPDVIHEAVSDEERIVLPSEQRA